MHISPCKHSSDTELVVMVRAGDEGAFAEIYNRYKGVLYLHALKMLHDQDEARDVVQELFTNLWCHKTGLVIRTTLSAYLYTATRNRVLDVFAHQKVAGKHQDSLQQFIDTGDYITDSQVREKELTELINKEIEALPLKMRQIFELSRKKFLTHLQIAEELNLSPLTVKKQINNAINRLRPKFDLLVFLAAFSFQLSAFSYQLLGISY